MKSRKKLIGNFREDLKRDGFIDVDCYFEIKPRKFMIGATQIVNMETSELVDVAENGTVKLKQDKKYHFGQIKLDQRKYNFECKSPYSIEDDGIDIVKANLMSKGFIPLTYEPKIDPEKYLINRLGVVIIVKGKYMGKEPVREPVDEETCYYKLMVGDGEYVYRTNRELIENQLKYNEEN